MKPHKLQEKIERILEQNIRPMLQEHGGNVKFHSFEDGVVWIELLGACSGCPMADLSTRLTIEEILKAEIPQIKQVELTQSIDAELFEFMEKIVKENKK